MDQPAAPTAPAPRQARSRQFRNYGICLLVGLLIGLIPTGLRLIQTQRERDVLQQRLQVANLEMNLASAALMARYGDYAAARDAASRFFDDARQHVEAGDNALTAAQLTSLRSALAERDALITLLARGDAAGAERATTIYVAHRGVFPR
jgi:uncharacterized membrane-anchored protein YhcB (DUF1043 family)